MLKLSRLIITFLFIVFNSMTTTHATLNPLTKTFSSTTNHYSIQYPASLACYDRGKGLVIFKGSAGNPPHPLFINIQTLYTKQDGGTYATVKDLMDDFISQVPLHTQDAKFLERKPIILFGRDGEKLIGEETTLIFRENHQTLKQWQVMIMSRNGNLFQAFAYRALEHYYETNRPLAATMLASWIIN